MNSVWIASYSDMRDYDWIMGAYTTQEAAKQAIEEYKREIEIINNEDPDDYYWRVREFEVVA